MKNDFLWIESILFLDKERQTKMFKIRTKKTTILDIIKSRFQRFEDTIHAKGD